MVKNNTDPADGQPRVVLLERRERVAILTINRPEARNAINRAVAEALTRHLDDLEADDDIWVIVVTGAGDSNDTREGRQAFVEKRSPDWTAT